MSFDHVEQDALRWYTPALRIPKFLGKLPSGERLPGGPYTQAQGAVFAVVVVAAGSTLQWWRPLLLPEGQLWGLGAYVIVIAAAVAAGMAARFAPRTSMNPVTILGGIVQQVRRGAGPDRRPGPRAVRGPITITAPAPSTSRTPVPARAAAAPVGMAARPARGIDAASSAAPTSRSAGERGRHGGSAATPLAALVAAAPGRAGGA